jgi:hypothetical protein
MVASPSTFVGRLLDGAVKKVACRPRNSSSTLKTYARSICRNAPMWLNGITLLCKIMPVLGPDVCHVSTSCVDGEAAHSAILYAFDLIEHDGEDLRDRPFLDRKAALARLLHDTEAGIVLNEHVAGDGLTVFEHACRLGAEGIVQSGWTAPIDPVRARRGSRFAIPRVSRCSGSAVRSGTGDPDCLRAVPPPLRAD